MGHLLLFDSWRALQPPSLERAAPRTIDVGVQAMTTLLRYYPRGVYTPIPSLNPLMFSLELDEEVTRCVRGSAVTGLDTTELLRVLIPNTSLALTRIPSNKG